MARRVEAHAKRQADAQRAAFAWSGFVGNAFGIIDLDTGLQHLSYSIRQLCNLCECAGVMGRLALEVREMAIEMLTAGFKPAAVARELGIHRNTVSNWVRKDHEFRGRLLDKQFESARAVLDHHKNLEQMAFDLNQPGHVRLRASLEVLKALDPITWDPACRRRHAEAEEPGTFNPRIQYQEYLDKRDERIQAENAAKALEAKVKDKEDPKGQLSLQLFIDDLRKVQHEAGKEAAKQADNYEAD